MLERLKRWAGFADYRLEIGQLFDDYIRVDGTGFALDRLEGRQLLGDKSLRQRRPGFFGPGRLPGLESLKQFGRYIGVLVLDPLKWPIVLFRELHPRRSGDKIIVANRLLRN